MSILTPLLASFLHRRLTPHFGLTMTPAILQCGVKQVTSVRTICEAINTQQIYKSMLYEVYNLLTLYLTIPITSATAERSFSALQNILTYLRSSMTEQRLNNCMLFHIHKHLTDSLDLIQIAKEFIAINAERKLYFGGTLTNI